MPVVKPFCVVRNPAGTEPPGVNDWLTTPKIASGPLMPSMRAAGPVEERVTDPVSGADGSLRIETVSQAQARPEILVIRIHERAIKQAA